jgi:hypothetical protein
MCGREPNFELSEEDKLELQGFQWDEFLELTRKSILNKSKVQSLQSFATVMLFVTVSFITILHILGISWIWQVSIHLCRKTTCKARGQR